MTNYYIPIDDNDSADSEPVLVSSLRASVVGTTNHAARRELAAKVLAAPNGWAEVFAVGVATNPNIGTGTSDPVDDDGALGFVVASIWDAYTG